MTFHFSRSTRLMSIGIVLSMGWFLFEACDCDETKEDQYPGFWVACVDDKPTLMTYNDNDATVVTSDPAGFFDPTDYDCTHAGSPQYKGSEDSPPFQVSSSPAGPGGYARQAHAAPPPQYAFLPQQLRDLPFLPHVPVPSTPPQCDSSYADVFHTNHNNGLLTRFSTCPFQIKAVIPVGNDTNTLQVAITPDGSTAVVTSFDSQLSFVNLATNTVTQTLLLDSSLNPDGVAISPDGTRAYVTSFNNNSPAPVIMVFDLTTAAKTMIAQIPTIQFPSGATLTPDGSQLWITSPLAFDMAVIDTLTNTNIINLGIGTTTDVAFNSTGTRAYLTSGATQPGKVFVVDTSTFQTVSSYTVGNNPADIKMSYGDQWLVVNNADDGTISVVDLQKNAVVTSAKLGTAVSGIAFVH
jgi:DNA-binding beta-propeller fold protein YncE